MRSNFRPPNTNPDRINRLVDALWWRHGSLDGQGTNVLPSLLQERDEVVDGQHNVTDQLILSHTNVSDGDTQAKNLLELELDGGLDIGDLGGEILSVGDWGWELAGLGETWTEETGDLLDELLRGEESVVLLGELLDELLVLVELLQILNGHGLESQMLSTIDIVLVTKNAVFQALAVCSLIGSLSGSLIPNAHSWAWDLWKLDGSGETLVSLGIIVLQSDLELDGLEEVSLLDIERVIEKFLNVSTHSGYSEQLALRSGSNSTSGSNVPTVIFDDILTVFQASW